jgi:diacylglycerol kinase family enzyme
LTVPGIAVVTNPRSRQNRRNPGMAGQMAYMLGSRGQVAQPQNREELIDTARRFRDAGVDVLAVNGGDGTLHVVMTAFAKAYGDETLPPVAILRGGTMNTVASGLGITGTPAQLLEALSTRYHTGEPLPMAERHLLRVTAGEDVQYGFLFGNGFIANFLQLYYESPEPTPWRGAWLLARATVSVVVGGAFARRIIHPIDLTIEADGETWPCRPYLTVTVGTVDDIGFGFRCFYEVLRHPGRMHAICMGGPPLGVVKDFPNFYLARPPRSPDIYTAIPRRLLMSSDRPQPYMIDGDFHPGGQSVELTVGPRVRFVLP